MSWTTGRPSQPLWQLRLNRGGSRRRSISSHRYVLFFFFFLLYLFKKNDYRYHDNTRGWRTTTTTIRRPPIPTTPRYNHGHTTIFDHPRRVDPYFHRQHINVSTRVYHPLSTLTTSTWGRTEREMHRLNVYILLFFILNHNLHLD